MKKIKWSIHKLFVLFLLIPIGLIGLLLVLYDITFTDNKSDENTRLFKKSYDKLSLGGGEIVERDKFNKGALQREDCLRLLLQKRRDDKRA